jgi:hypothetical protein
MVAWGDRATYAKCVTERVRLVRCAPLAQARRPCRGHSDEPIYAPAVSRNADSFGSQQYGPPLDLEIPA